MEPSSRDTEPGTSWKRQVAEPDKKTFVEKFRGLSPNLKVLFTITAISSLVAAAQSYLPAYLKGLNYDDADLNDFYFWARVSGIGAILAGFLIVDRVNRRKLMIGLRYALAANVLLFAALSRSTSTDIFLFGTARNVILFYNAAMGALTVLLMVANLTMVQHEGEDRPGFANSLFKVCQSIGPVVGAIGWSYVVLRIDDIVLWYSVAGAGLLTSTLFAVCSKPTTNYARLDRHPLAELKDILKNRVVHILLAVAFFECFNFTVTRVYLVFLLEDAGWGDEFIKSFFLLERVFAAPGFILLLVLMDRIGVWRTYLAGQVMTSLALVGIGLFTFGHLALAVAVVVAVYWFGYAWIHAAQANVLYRVVDKAHYGMAWALNLLVYQVGAAGITKLWKFLVDNYHMQSATLCIIGGCLSLVAALLLVKMVRRPPDEAGVSE
ncbi:MAG: MFS transporter [Planctomycetia bacterium]|nr:MFS transporter [Planctomycetia bacterium]